MHSSWLLVLLATAWLTVSLVPLEREELEGKYEIGTIESLHFFKDRIFFRSDDDLFGFLGQKDGQLLAVYELELGERIVNQAGGMEVVIAREKKLNMFWPPKAQYVRSYETKFLEKHPDFTTIVAYKKSPKGALVLTDKYLLFVPNAPKGTKLEDLQEKVLVELTDPTEAFYALVDLYNQEDKRPEVLLASLLQNDKVSQVCFRRVGEEKPARQCFDLQAGDSVEDVVSSGSFIFVELSAGAIVLDLSLKVVERLASKPLQYFAGMVTVGEDHQFYAPHSKTLHDLLIIDHSGKGAGYFMGLKVEDSLLSLQKLVGNSTF